MYFSLYNVYTQVMPLETPASPLGLLRSVYTALLSITVRPVVYGGTRDKEIVGGLSTPFVVLSKVLSDSGKGPSGVRMSYITRAPTQRCVLSDLG